MALMGPSIAEQCIDGEPCIFVEESGDQFAVLARNTKAFDITLGLTLELTNMSIVAKAETGDNTLFVVPGKSQIVLLKLVKQDKFRKFQYEYSFSWLQGDVFAKHDNSLVYSLPYAPGQTFYISQSCDGSESHGSSGNQNAIDFAMPIGTPVHAARAGRVVNLHEVSISGGTSTLNYDEGNFVQLRHADGTTASYHHLRTMGVKVNIGDMVKQGDFIGYSGNTGFTSGPHLHFVVQKPDSARSTTSLPINWKTSRGILSCPRMGLALKSVRP